MSNHVWLAWKSVYDEDTYCNDYTMLGVYATLESARVPAREWIDSVIDGEEPVVETWDEESGTLVLGITQPERPSLDLYHAKDPSYNQLEYEYHDKMRLYQGYRASVVREEVLL